MLIAQLIANCLAILDSSVGIFESTQQSLAVLNFYHQFIAAKFTWAVFKIPLSFYYTGWFIGTSRSWIIRIPNIYQYIYIKGSIIPKLIINQQGFSSHCSLLEWFYRSPYQLKRLHHLTLRRPQKDAKTCFDIRSMTFPNFHTLW